MNAFDGQVDFSGGMNDRLAPEQLSKSEYAYGENLEIRDGYARTRRGSHRLYEWLSDATFQGAGVYRAFYSDQRRETLFLVRNGTIYRANLPQYPDSMLSPDGVTLSTETRMRFVQAFQYMYLLRGLDNPPLRWESGADDWVDEMLDEGSGQIADENGTPMYAEEIHPAWSLVPTPETGSPMPNSDYGKAFVENLSKLV